MHVFHLLHDARGQGLGHDSIFALSRALSIQRGIIYTESGTISTVMALYSTNLHESATS